MRKGASVCVPHCRPLTHFCICEGLTFICDLCIPTHSPRPTHEVFPIAQIPLFHSLSENNAALHARNQAVDACQAYCDRMHAEAAAVRKEADSLLAEVTQTYSEVIKRRAEGLSRLLDTMKSETLRYATEVEPDVSPLARGLLEAWESLSDSRPISPEVAALRAILLGISACLRTDFALEASDLIARQTKPTYRSLFSSLISPQTQAVLLKLGPYDHPTDLSKPVFKGETEYDGGVYEGEWSEKSLRHGLGKQVWPGGNLYEGMWREDKQQGRGRLVWGDDGTVYEGEFVANRREGFGTYSYPDGDIYCGGWVNDQRSGFGCVQFSPMKESLCYFGEFLAGQRHGRGALFWRDGGVYVGEWREDKRHGTGLQSWPNGRIYFGGYSESKFHGAGCDVSANGTVFKGVWANGKKQPSNIGL